MLGILLDRSVLVGQVASTVGAGLLALVLGGSGLGLVAEVRVQYWPIHRTLARSTDEPGTR